ncbi:MAG: hypothetical protein R6U68_06120 [Desulfobacteraceae bacterium]
MGITWKDICEYRKKLIAKHPSLNNLIIKSLQDSSISSKDLAGFIESVWSKDYQNEARLVFTPEFLEYNEPELDMDCSLVAIENHTLTGCFLSYTKKYSYQGTAIQTAHNTGLTVARDNGAVKDLTGGQKRGRGTGQLLWIEQMRMAFEKGYDATTYWLDTRHDKPGDSSRIFGNNKVTAQESRQIPIMAKSFSLDRSCRYGNLNFLEKTGIRVVNAVFAGNPKNQSIEADQDYRSAAAFLESLEDICTPVPGQDLLRNKARYCSGSLKSLLMNFKQDSKTIGIMYGFTIPVNEWDNYFQVDGFFFKPGLDWKTKREMILLAEKTIIERYGSFSCLIPANCTNEKLWKHGYVPAESQNLIINSLKDLGDWNLPIELR